MPWGGAYRRVPTHATAFAHRDQLFQLKHAAVIDADAPATAQRAAARHVHASWAAVHANGSGRVFPNFADPDLPQWDRAYHGANLERLLRVKARYDPTDFFRH